MRLKLEKKSIEKSAEAPEIEDFEFDGEVCLIGRTDADLLLSDPRCSKQQAIFYQSKGAVLKIKDLGSTNGTYMESRRIKEVELQIDSEVRIGKIHLKVKEFTAIPEKTAEQTFTKTGRLEPIVLEQVDGGVLKEGPDKFYSPARDQEKHYIEYIDKDGVCIQISVAQWLRKRKRV